jgi:hypothetical protein
LKNTDKIVNLRSTADPNRLILISKHDDPPFPTHERKVESNLELLTKFAFGAEVIEPKCGNSQSSQIENAMVFFGVSFITGDAVVDAVLVLVLVLAFGFVFWPVRNAEFATQICRIIKNIFPDFRR